MGREKMVTFTSTVLTVPWQTVQMVWCRSTGSKLQVEARHELINRAQGGCSMACIMTAVLLGDEKLCAVVLGFNVLAVLRATGSSG